MGVARFRSQTVLPAVMAIMIIILLTYTAIMSVKLHSLAAMIQIEQEKRIAARVAQIDFVLYRYEWLPVNEYEARLRLDIVNVGRTGAKIVYVAVALEDSSKWPPVWLWAEEWGRVSVNEHIGTLKLEPDEWSADNHPVVRPNGHLIIETTKPINLAELYYNPNVTVVVYIVTAEEAKVQTLRILGKPSCLEVLAFIEGSEAAITSVQLARYGTIEWPAELIEAGNRVKICGLAPGEYTVKITAARGGATTTRKLTVTLDEGETETIVLDLTSPPPTRNTTSSYLVLRFNDASSFAGWWRYVHEGLVSYGGNVTELFVDKDHGLGVKCEATDELDDACYVEIHPSVSGRYTMILTLWVDDPCAENGCRPEWTAKWALTSGSSTNHTLTRLLNATLRLQVYVGDKLVFDNDWADIVPARPVNLFTNGYTNATVLTYSNGGVCEAAIVDKVPDVGWAGLITTPVPADVIIVCRGVKLDPSATVKIKLWYNWSYVAKNHLGAGIPDKLYAFTVWQLDLKPEARNVTVWEGELWPGDVFELRNNTLVKVVDGVIAYWSLDGSLKATVGEGEWLLRGDVRATNWLESVIDGGKLLQVYVGPGSARLTANLECPGDNNTCVLYAYARGSYSVTSVTPLGLTMVSVSPTLLVDGESVATAPGTWPTYTLLKARLTPGTHNVTILLGYSIAVTGLTIPNAPPLPAYIDHIILARSNNIVVKGLKPGATIYVYDENENLLYRATALGDEVAIPAEELGIWRFPLKAKIVVVLP